MTQRPTIGSFLNSDIVTFDFAARALGNKRERTPLVRCDGHVPASIGREGEIGARSNAFFRLNRPLNGLRINQDVSALHESTSHHNLENKHPQHNQHEPPPELRS